MKKAILASYLLIAAMMILSIILRNYEFVIYAGVLLPFVGLIHATDKRFNYNNLALWGFALWALLHMLGGLLVLKGVRLYDWMPYVIVGEPYNILKYDQILHVYFYIIAAILLGSVVSDVVRKNANRWTISIIIVLAACGIGAINEILEFLPVVFFNSPGPGGYINTSIDIITNLIGSVIGTWIYMKKYL